MLFQDSQGAGEGSDMLGYLLQQEARQGFALEPCLFVVSSTQPRGRGVMNWCLQVLQLLFTGNLRLF